MRGGLRTATAAAIIAAAFAFVAAPASAAPVRANVISLFKGKVACGVNLKLAGSGISCFSEALPPVHRARWVRRAARPRRGEDGRAGGLALAPVRQQFREGQEAPGLAPGGGALLLAGGPEL
ncbi:MAG: hypothetical protein ACXWZ3_11615, partial [Solirubrobacterales bacterium]